MLTFKLWQRSSVVEQGTHKPLVAGSNPAAATIKLKSASNDLTVYRKEILFLAQTIEQNHLGLGKE
jgi:hypothetical protein